MVKHYLKWCPKGCGKSVIYWQNMQEIKGKKYKGYYTCQRCKEKYYNKEELKW